MLCLINRSSNYLFKNQDHGVPPWIFGWACNLILVTLETSHLGLRTLLQCSVVRWFPFHYLLFSAGISRAAGPQLKILQSILVEREERGGQWEVLVKLCTSGGTTHGPQAWFLVTAGILIIPSDNQAWKLLPETYFRTVEVGFIQILYITI